MKMFNWLFYSIALPLIPIPVAYVVFRVINSPKSFAMIVRDGQLCVFSTTLSADAVHQFIGLNQQYSDLAVAWLLTIIIVCDSFYGLALVSDKITGLDGPRFEKAMARISGASVVLSVVVIGFARHEWGLT